jgi:aconitase A
MGFMEKIFTVGNGTGTALGKNGHSMKKNQQILKARTRLSLGDLILAVSSCTNSSRETVATVADLLASGQVRVHDNGRFLRARVC